MVLARHKPVILGNFDDDDETMAVPTVMMMAVTVQVIRMVKALCGDQLPRQTVKRSHAKICF